jgi:hypothetical protein
LVVVDPTLQAREAGAYGRLKQQIIALTASSGAHPANPEHPP